MIRWFVFALICRLVLKTVVVVLDKDKINTTSGLAFSVILGITSAILFWVFIVIGVIKVLSVFGIYL
jgi:hypothetical protein